MLYTHMYILKRNIVAAFWGMHVLPAKHSYVWLPRKCDYRTDTHRQTQDKVIPLATGNTKTQSEICWFTSLKETSYIVLFTHMYILKTKTQSEICWFTSLKETSYIMLYTHMYILKTETQMKYVDLRHWRRLHILCYTRTCTYWRQKRKWNMLIYVIEGDFIYYVIHAHVHLEDRNASEICWFNSSKTSYIDMQTTLLLT